LVLEDGIAARGEVPEGWGLLIRTGDTLQLVRAAPVLAPEARQREALRAVVSGRTPVGCTSAVFPELFAHA
jgi:hypothetical protein